MRHTHIRLRLHTEGLLLAHLANVIKKAIRIPSSPNELLPGADALARETVLEFDVQVPSVTPVDREAIENVRYEIAPRAQSALARLVCFD